MEKQDFFDKSQICAENDRFLLRKLGKQDKKEYLELIGKSSIFRNLNKAKPTFDFKGYLDWVWEQNEEEDAVFVSIIKKDENVFAGYMDLMKLESRTPEIGIEIKKEYQRQGIARSVFPLFMDKIREVMPVEHFVIRIASDNLPSQKLFEQLGAVETGKEPSEYRMFLNQMKEEIPDWYEEKVTQEMEEEADRTWIIHYKVSENVDNP